MSSWDNTFYSLPFPRLLACRQKSSQAEKKFCMFEHSEFTKLPARVDFCKRKAELFFWLQKKNNQFFDTFLRSKKYSRLFGDPKKDLNN